MAKVLAVNAVVEKLDEAFEQHVSIAPLTEQYPSLTVEEAYAVQMNRVEQALRSGEVISGKKIGLTSEAMQNLLGVDQPDYGHLFQSMEVQHGASVQLSQLFQPKVEGEIAFVLKEDLAGPNVTAEDVLQATDYVVAAIEIVDSRIKDWRIKIEDTVADNASCGLYVLGTTKRKVNEIELQNIEMQLQIDGQVYNEGRGSDVLGDPALCVAWLANKLYEYGARLQAGEVVLSGALSAAAVAVEGNTYTAQFTELGEVTVRFEK